DEPPVATRRHAVAHRPEDRVLAELMVDGDDARAALGARDDLVRVGDRLDERLLAEDVQPGVERLEAELGMRGGRRRDDRDVRPRLLDELVERLECWGARLRRPRRASLRRDVEPADDLDALDAAERGQVVENGRPAEPDRGEPHVAPAVT